LELVDVHCAIVVLIDFIDSDLDYSSLLHGFLPVRQLNVLPSQPPVYFVYRQLLVVVDVNLPEYLFLVIFRPPELDCVAYPHDVIVDDVEQVRIDLRLVVQLQHSQLAIQDAHFALLLVQSFGCASR